MKVRIVDVVFYVTSFTIGFFAVGCVPLQDLHQVAHVAEEVDNIIHAVSTDGPTNWAGIIETVGYSVAGIAALIGSAEAIRRKMKRKKKMTAARAKAAAATPNMN